MPSERTEPLFDSADGSYVRLLAWVAGDHECRSLLIDVRLEHDDEEFGPTYEIRAKGWLLYPDEHESGVSLDYIGSGPTFDRAAERVLGQIELADLGVAVDGNPQR